MSDLSQHGEWLSLIDVSGPFLAEPVLKQVFPQGLEQIDPLNRKLVRQAYEEWREAIDLDDPQLPAFHKAWVDLVLKRVLELNEDDEEDILKPQAKLSDALGHLIPEHGITMRPDYAVVDEQNNDRPLMLIQVFPHDANLDEPVKGDGWATSPAERMVALCRANDVRLGLLTNGERWMLIDAPVGAVTTFASWYARLWGQEPITLQAFVNLLGIRRFFVDPSEQLPALFDESLKLQDEVTDALGEQVRRAVEVLIQRLDRADVDLNRELLVGVEPSELYEAALTIMMRIVFLLSAEERDLLLMGDERYEANYAVSTLRMQLRAESEEILERRQDAWSRLLSIFRAVYGGIQHETMRLPALGGSLFDPDRFPFLEGRAKGSNWKVDPAKPLPIDNRTVLLLLDAVQLFQGRTLSYRALDVEQIGYVYEGLLERTVVRADEVTLDLDAAKKSKKPWVTLDELDAAAGEGDKAVAALLKERTGSSASRIKNDSVKKVDEAAADKLLTACHGDQALRERIKPYFHFLRIDRWGYPLVYPEKTFMVTTGAARRETGTHYTPKSLTEAIVKETLEPVVYVGAAEGKPREEWALKTPAGLLDLKICDPAMGSGAFLVQACRYMSERLVEAWENAESQDNAVTSEGVVVEKVNGYEPLRNDPEERLLTARRLIAERCLYGVDINPLAVELAKLSIWLITLAKGRPFGFLDHNLRSGDSLLGVRDLDQLHYLDMTPGKGSSKKLFAQKIDQAVDAATELRSQLRIKPIRDIHDVEVMAGLDDRARRVLELPELIADALTGDFLEASGMPFDATALSIEAGSVMDAEGKNTSALQQRADRGLSAGLLAGASPRRPLHWPLEFPEVFGLDHRGFDAVIGNPPYMGGRVISTRMGQTYYQALDDIRNHVSGSPDLAVFFLLRGFALLKNRGSLGFVTTSAIKDTGNKDVGFEQIVGQGASIYSAIASMPWPGSASVTVSVFSIFKGEWRASRSLENRTVSFISTSLDELPDFAVQKLKCMRDAKSDGFKLMGEGFVLSKSEKEEIENSDKNSEEILRPYFGGDDITDLPKLMPQRWVIDFEDKDEEESAQWKTAFSRVVREVKPFRDRQTGQIHQDCFWKFWDMRPKLRKAQAADVPYLVMPSVSKYIIFRRYVGKGGFNQKTKAVFFSDFLSFAVLQSNIHDSWVRWRSGARGVTLSYSTSKALDTFPMPKGGMQELESIGKRYYELRDDILVERNIGPTDFYNMIHSENENDKEIREFRIVSSELDRLVVGVYGWSDLELEHGFYDLSFLPGNDKRRFSISERSRQEILRRLSELNAARHAEESGPQAANEKASGLSGKQQVLLEADDLFLLREESDE